MKRKPKHAASRAIEFLPKTFFFAALCETERLSLHQEHPHDEGSSNEGGDGQHAMQTSSAKQPRFPATPGIQYVSLDEQLALRAADPARSENGLHQTVRFYDFLTGFLNNSDDPSSPDRIPRVSSSSSGGGRQSPKVHYFYLRRRDVDAEIRAIHLICRWRLLHLQLSPQEAIAPFEHLPFLFPSTACSVKRTLEPMSSSQLPVNLLVSLVGFAKGMQMELLGSSPSSVDALRLHTDQKRIGTLGDGAMAWITKRLMVFAGPHDPDPPPEDTATAAEASADVLVNDQEARSQVQVSPTTKSLALLLKQHKVALVIRLNKQSYDETPFTESGMKVLDLSPPPPSIVAEDTKPQTPILDDSVLVRFLDACESATAAVAVHSSAGSGRAATFIGCYLMKHLQFTSQEAFGWISVCCSCPSSSSRLTHMHRLFLDRMQMRMWRDGDAFRRDQSVGNAAVHPSSAAQDDEFLKSTDSLHISIGNISLGRNSLFGTKAANGHSAVQANTSREPHAPPAQELHPYPQQSDPLGAPQHLKRRPLTQGSGGRRPRVQSYYRSGENGVLRADFAQMHKFLHQAGSSSAVPSSSPAARVVVTPPRSAGENSHCPSQEGPPHLYHLSTQARQGDN